MKFNIWCSYGFISLSQIENPMENIFSAHVCRNNKIKLAGCTNGSFCFVTQVLDICMKTVIFYKQQFVPQENQPQFMKTPAQN